MKHVFLVNSNLHVRNCVAIVKLLGLATDNVLFIKRRDLEIKENFETLHLNKDLKWKFFPFASPLKFLLLLIWFSFIGRSIICRKLNTLLLNEKFHLYLPHIIAPDIRMLMNFPTCTGLSVVDEGTNGFIVPNAKIPLTKIETKIYFKYLLKLLGLESEFNRDQIMPNCKNITHVFSPHNHSFYFYDKRKFQLIPEQLVFPMSEENKRKKSDKNIHLFLIDPFAYENRIDKSIYKQQLEKIFHSVVMAQNLSLIYISFHPTMRHDYQYTNSILKVIEDLDVEFVVVEEDLEELFLTKNGTLYGTYSSSMIWAKKFGWKVYSWVSLLPAETYSLINQTNPIEFYLDICGAKQLEVMN